MTPFALPYNPDAAPVLWLVGHGFVPAWQPADFIGPRMSCPMWLPAPDADAAMVAKVPPALAPVDPYGHLTSWGTVLPERPMAGAQPSAAELAGPVATAPWHPVAAAPFTAGPLVPGPWWPPVDYPCRCITPDAPELPPMAPVPVAASGLMLAVAVAALSLRPAWRSLKSPRRHP